MADEGYLRPATLYAIPNVACRVALRVITDLVFAYRIMGEGYKQTASGFILEKPICWCPPVSSLPLVA